MFPKKGKLELGGDKLQASLIFGSSEVRGFEGLCRVACNLTPIIPLCHVGGMYYWGYFRRVLLPVGHPVVPRVCPWCGQSCSKSLLHDQYKSGQLLRLCAIKIQLAAGSLVVHRGICRELKRWLGQWIFFWNMHKSWKVKKIVIFIWVWFHPGLGLPKWFWLGLTQKMIWPI